MAVKYRTSLPAGAAFDGNFIWARAKSGEAVTRPNRQSMSARISNSPTGRITIVVSSKPAVSSPKKKAARRRPSIGFCGNGPGSEAHAAHSTHAAAAARHRRGRLPRQFGDHGFRGDQKASHGGGVLQRSPHHLGGVDDALGNHVDIFLGLGI